MANFNRIILCGNLCRDPQLKYLPNQTAIVEFGLAVNRKFKVNGEDREEVLFVDCVLFGKGAEVINQYCVKGGQLLVEGRLKLDVWEDKQGGGKRSKHSVIVENFQLMGGKRDGGEAPPAREAQRPAAKPLPSDPFADQQGQNQFQESDVPF